MGKLSDYPNIGDVLERQLCEAGIETIGQLRETGSKQAWLRIRQADPSACYARLCALEGAIRGVRWHQLPGDVKQDLKSFYQSARG